MPSRPQRLCPKCKRPWSGGKCGRCGHETRQTWEDDKRRGSRIDRGYDEAWIKLRAKKIATDPWCEEHLEQGELVPAEEVHHIMPFDGLDDPLRLDWDNLRSLCKPCHKAKRRKGKRTP